MLKPVNEGIKEEMCVCTEIFGFSQGFSISDRISELQLLHTTKKNPFLLSGDFSPISDVASEKQNLHLCHTPGYSNSKPFQRWSKDFQEGHYSHLIVVWWAGYQNGSRREKQEAVVWCDIQRYRQRFSQFHSIGVAELFTASVRKFFWKKSAKVKETNLIQTGQQVKTLLGSQSLGFLIPKSVTSEWIL